MTFIYFISYFQHPGNSQTWLICCLHYLYCLGLQDYLLNN